MGNIMDSPIIAVHDDGNVIVEKLKIDSLFVIFSY